MVARHTRDALAAHGALTGTVTPDPLTSRAICLSMIHQLKQLAEGRLTPRALGLVNAQACYLLDTHADPDGAWVLGHGQLRCVAQLTERLTHAVGVYLDCLPGPPAGAAPTGDCAPATTLIAGAPSDARARFTDIRACVKTAFGLVEKSPTLFGTRAETAHVFNGIMTRLDREQARLEKQAYFERLPRLKA